MFSFFQVNDPFRLIGVAVYVILISVIYLVFFPFPVTEPTLLWMVLGERLNDGLILYRDVIDDTGPLSAGFFSFMDWVFGRNQTAYEIVGRLIILFQIFHWNSTLLRYRVFDDNTYLPAIFMAAMFHFSFDMLSLSPSLLGSTFLVLALGQLFSQTVLQKETSESTLLIGIYGGLAAGFHLHFIIFLPYILFTGIVISGFSLRQILLAITGFMLPVVLILVFYFWNNALPDLLDILPVLFTYPKYSYQSIISWLIPASVPLILATIGLFASTFFRGATINQQKQRQLIVLWMIFSALVFLIIKKQASYQLVVFIPGLSYLLTQFSLNFKSSALGKLGFYLIFLGMPVVGVWYWQSQSQNFNHYFVNEAPEFKNVQGKEILVMGDNSHPYLYGKLGGPFLNFHLSKEYLQEEKSLESKTRIYRKINRQKPEIIFDPEGFFKEFMEEFPATKAWYLEKEKGVFLLK